MSQIASLLLRLRNRHFFFLDVLLLLGTPALALILRTDRVTAVEEFEVLLLLVTLVFLGVKLGVFYAAGLYRRYWRYASIEELARIIGGVVGATLVQTLLFFLVLRPFIPGMDTFPRSVTLLDGLLTLMIVGGTRYSIRLAQRATERAHENGDSKRALIVGAGRTGLTMLDEMRKNPDLGLLPVAFVDDDLEKQGMRIRGLDVLGGRETIPALVETLGVDEIVIAIPSASGQVLREIAGICKQTGVETKTMPGVYELLDERLSLGLLRDVQVEDLLRRPPVQIQTARVAELLQGQRVLVTGAGGSIGSELCRQILLFQPAELLLLGHGENSIFQVEAELRRRLEVDGIGRPPVRLHSIIADVRDRERMHHVFGLYQPEFVFHAAAHKHVPLMEANPEDAVTNNVLGTRTMLDCAVASGVERFVLISTDKAVNPTSVMGATKRVAELLVRDAALRTGRAFSAVRFGNVLGSRGSVLEVFREQLRRGGPLTVTHPDVRRYFMTIPEAVHLVLQAATLGTGAEVFMLEMGEPVRIVDLARDLIQLSARRGKRDIDIVFTGLRPGEKLFEELSGLQESLRPTEHQKILVCVEDDEDGQAARSPRSLHSDVTRLVHAARDGDRAHLEALLRALVPTYTSPSRPAPVSSTETVG